MTDNDVDCYDGDPARGALIAAVRDASGGLPWGAARRQWDVVGVDHDGECKGVCLCGQTGLGWLYTIGNRVTGAVLHPIGSDCIEHFRVDEMDAAAHDLRQLRELAEIVRRGGRLVLKGAGRNLTQARLAVLFEAGAIQPSQWNGGDPQEDLAFLGTMFRKRSALSAAQGRKVFALLAGAATWLRGSVSIPETVPGRDPHGVWCASASTPDHMCDVCWDTYITQAGDDGDDGEQPGWDADEFEVALHLDRLDAADAASAVNEARLCEMVDERLDGPLREYGVQA